MCSIQAESTSKPLTVPHLEDAALALEVRGQLVLHVHLGAAPAPPVEGLLDLLLTAGGVHVVPARVVGVDGAVGIVALRTREGVLVEALLGGHAIGVGQVGSIADEELQVALGLGTSLQIGRWGRGGKGRIVRFQELRHWHFRSLA